MHPAPRRAVRGSESVSTRPRRSPVTALVVAMAALTAGGCDYLPSDPVETAIDYLLVDLQWDDAVDLDLVVLDANVDEVSYTNDRTRTGAQHSGDAVSGGGSGESVEWRRGAPGGFYHVQVKNQSGSRSGNYRVRVEGGGTDRTFTGTVAPGQTVTPVSLIVADGSMVAAGSGGTGAAGRFAGAWNRYGHSSYVEIKVGGIPGESANRVYMCQVSSSSLYRGTVQSDGATIRWDASHNVPDYVMEENGTNRMRFFVPVMNAYGGTYQKGSWTKGACGLSL